MNKKTVWIIIILVLIVISLVIASNQGGGGVIYEVVRNEPGYQPSELTINRGDTVRFINRSGTHHWPASDLHPTHGIYPDFDSRRAIADGEVWEFSFDKKGEWKFHDHLRANLRGVITVD